MDSGWSLAFKSLESFTALGPQRSRPSHIVISSSAPLLTPLDLYSIRNQNGGPIPTGDVINLYHSTVSWTWPPKRQENTSWPISGHLLSPSLEITTSFYHF